MANQEHIKLSILVPTIGRKHELAMLLQSILDSALHFNYEIIIVDQNPSGFLKEVLDLKITHRKVLEMV